ncbi:MAG: hypothetical protein ACC628_23185 [Pirellulaceae bacterium]
MRTTVDIPDDLYRQAKSQAALRGVRLRDLVAEGLRKVLAVPTLTESPRRVRFPLHRSRQPGALAPEELRQARDDALLDEDSHHAGTL